MSEMKQRIARAIYDNLVKQGGFVINDGIDDNFDLTEVAMAVLAEVETAGLAIVPRKPTEAMVDAGNDVASLLAITHDCSAELTWERMIATAPKRCSAKAAQK